MLVVLNFSQTSGFRDWCLFHLHEHKEKGFIWSILASCKTPIQAWGPGPVSYTEPKWIRTVSVSDKEVLRFLMLVCIIAGWKRGRGWKEDEADERSLIIGSSGRPCGSHTQNVSKRAIGLLQGHSQLSMFHHIYTHTHTNTHAHTRTHRQQVGLWCWSAPKCPHNATAKKVCVRNSRRQYIKLFNYIINDYI